MRLLIGFILCFLLLSRFGASAQELSPQIQLHIEGNKVFATQEIVSVINRCLSANLQARHDVTTGDLSFCVRKVKRFLDNEGYLASTVSSLPGTRQTENGLNATVTINEGMRYRLGGVEIQGPKVFSSVELINMLTIKSGDIARGDVIQSWLEGKVRRAYADQGYVQMICITKPLFKSNGFGVQEGIVDLHIDVDEGRRFRVRAIKFEGNKTISQELFRSLILLREGDFFNQTLYETSISKINGLKLFEEIDAEKDCDMNSVTSEDSEPQIDLVIHLRERARL